MADWTNVTAPYNKIYDTYIDEHEIVTIDEKQPQIGEIGLIVAGDSNSQFMTFEINRYYDNIDLSNKLIKIAYLYEKNNEIKITKATKIYADDACNICYTDDLLRFSWLLPAEVALQEGKVAASISFIGLNDEQGYELKTTIFELEVKPSLASNESLEHAIKVTWFGDIESRIYKLEQHSGLVDLDYNTLINKPSINGTKLEGDIELTFIEQATQSELGGIKALPKETDQTQPVGIDEDGFLWVKPSSGGGGGGTGADGFSPIVSMSEEESGTLLTIVDKNGIKTAHIKNGKNGIDGTNGTNGKDGIDGVDGVDGFSPVPKIETIEGGTRITITKKDGDPEEAVIPNAQDGFSPTIATEEIDGGHKITITDKDGAKDFNVFDGADGEDGTSVTVKVEDVEGGHKVTFTDEDGEKSFTILDGSAVKISEEEGNIIENNNGLYATVDESAITENVKTALSNLYLALTGGTVKGVVNISVPNKVNNLFTVKRGTHDNTVLANFDGGHVVTGSDTQTGYCALSSMRKCASDNNRVNSAAFYCNADGTAIFTHKGGAIGVTGVQNDAWMKFNQNGFQVSYSGEYNKSATETYTLLDSHNIGNDATIKALEARIKVLEDKA